MDSSFVSTVAAWLQQGWAIPAIGLAVAGLAFLAGRRLLVRRRAAAPAAAPTIPPERGPIGERRTAARRGGHPVEIDLSDPDGSRPAQEGWVEDRSAHGLCLLLPHPAEVGSVWNVRPHHAPSTLPPVAVEVRSCTPEGSEWKLGCRFLKTPSYAVLLLFG
jgi:hypothetical protein